MPHPTARRSFIGAVVITVTLATGSTAAHASTVTTLTRAELVTALSASATVTAASESLGWRQVATATFGAPGVTGSLTTTETVAYDAATKRSLETTQGVLGDESIVAEVGTGTWRPVTTGTSTSAALKLLGRAGAHYVLDPDWSTEMTNVSKQAASVQIVQVPRSVTSAVETVQDDGTITYLVSQPGIDPTVSGTIITIHTAADGLLLGESFDIPGTDGISAGSGGVAVTYGAQVIDIPAATDTVTKAAVARATTALNLRQIVSDTADRVARTAATMARHAHRTIVPADIVLAARKVVKGAAAHISVTTVKGGVRLSSVNSFTHATVASTVVVELAAVVHSG